VDSSLVYGEAFYRINLECQLLIYAIMTVCALNNLIEVLLRYSAVKSFQAAEI
ncbi:MAG: hypothetical protein ACJAZA_002177, partial [Shewanella psychromarinicola]